MSTIGPAEESLNNDDTEESHNEALNATSTTLDPSEVEYFSKISDEWWDLRGKLRGLHTLNKKRVQFVRDCLKSTGHLELDREKPLQGLKILDVGCGGGIFSEPLARIGATVTGLDASEELINVAKNHAKLDPSLNTNLTYVCDTIENFCKEYPESFDAVVSSEVIEHVADAKLFLECNVAALKPGGSLCLTTINKTIWSWLGAIVLGEYVLRFLDKGTHEWKKFISPQKISRLLEMSECSTKLVRGIFYNPLTNQWSWSPSAAISYALHAVKPY